MSVPLRLLSVLGVYDLHMIVAAYNEHVEGTDSLSEASQQIARLALQTIGKGGTPAIENNADIIQDLLFSPYDMIVYDALKLLYGFQGIELITGILNLVYDEVFNMLDHESLDTENFVLVTAIGVLNQFEEKILLYNWLLKQFKREPDQGSRAAVIIILGLISWDQEISGRVEHWLSDILGASSGLLRLASAVALCLRKDSKGLPVIIAELMKGKDCFDPAGLCDVASCFSEQEYMGYMLPFVERHNSDPSALLAVERGCTYCFNPEDKEVHALILKNIGSRNPRVREYVVKRSFYCLPEPTIMAVLTSVAGFDPNQYVRAAAIEVLAGCEWSELELSEKKRFCSFLADTIFCEKEDGVVRGAAAQALSSILEEDERLGKVKALMTS